MDARKENTVMADIVYAIESGSQHSTKKNPLPGGPYRTRRGQAFDADHPLVKARPNLFTDRPPIVEGEVERATAAPGEKRATRRGR